MADSQHIATYRGNDRIYAEIFLEGRLHDIYAREENEGQRIVSHQIASGEECARALARIAVSD